MTLLEAIQSNPVLSAISAEYIESVFTRRSIDGAAEYTESSLTDLELATADLYRDLAIVPEFKEGQLSLKMDSGQLLQRAKEIYTRHGETDSVEGTGVPTISAIDV